MKQDQDDSENPGPGSGLDFPIWRRGGVGRGARRLGSEYMIFYLGHLEGVRAAPLKSKVLSLLSAMRLVKAPRG